MELKYDNKIIYLLFEDTLEIINNREISVELMHIFFFGLYRGCRSINELIEYIKTSKNFSLFKTNVAKCKQPINDLLEKLLTELDNAKKNSALN